MPTSENAEMSALRQKIRELTEQKRAGEKGARMVREMDKLLMRMEMEKELAWNVQHRELETKMQMGLELEKVKQGQGRQARIESRGRQERDGHARRAGESQERDAAKGDAKPNQRAGAARGNWWPGWGHYTRLTVGACSTTAALRSCTESNGSTWNEGSQSAANSAAG